MMRVSEKQKQLKPLAKEPPPFSSKKFIEDLNSPDYSQRKARRSTEKSLPTLRRIPGTGERSVDQSTVSQERTR